jgi:ankyrin repeat protein
LQKNISGENFLLNAANSGNLEVIKYLVENGLLNMNAKNDFGETPLFNAVCNGTFELIKGHVQAKTARRSASDMGV